MRDVNIDVGRGELLAITGRSGSGKTTLLNLLSGLDQPTGGAALVRGQDLSRMPERELVEFRGHRIGFLFQSFGRMPLLSAQENAELPLHIIGVSLRERRRRAQDALESVGLGPCAKHRPYELSGGEQHAFPSRGNWSPVLRWSSQTSLQGSWTPARPVRSSKSCGKYPTMVPLLY